MKSKDLRIAALILLLGGAGAPAFAQATADLAADASAYRLIIDQSRADRFRLEVFDATSGEKLFDSGIVSGSSLELSLPASAAARSLTYELRIWDAAGELLASQIAQLASAGGSGEISSLDFELIPAGTQVLGGAIQLAAPTSITGDLSVAGITRTGELRRSANTAFVGTCAAGSAIRSIDAAGAVQCEPDDLHNHIATRNIVMNGFWISGDGGNEGIFVNAAGNVGIGTSDVAASRLRIDGGAEGSFSFNFTSGVPIFRLASADSDPAVLSLEAPAGAFQLRVTSNNEFQIFTSAPVVTIDSSGRVGIAQPDPAFQLHLGVDSAAKPGSATWTIASDARLKDVEGPFRRGLEALSGLQPVRFRYRPDNDLGLPADRSYVGLLAQEVAATIPEAVKEGPGGYLHLETDPILWTLLNAVRQLEARNRELASALGATGPAGQP